MDERAYNLWVQQALGAGSTKPRRILEQYGSYCEFYQAGRSAWRLDGFFSIKELEKLSSLPLESAQALLAYCEKLGQRVLTPESPEYPALLKQIHNPPCALYVRGELPPVDSLPAIAIVGTRRATHTGVSAAFDFAHELAKAGAVVVSGGALGVDTAAHKGALQAGGKTICVLGCGIDVPYLMQNSELREAIARQGALVSEYPPNTPASVSSFPIRNRIISGLCVGTLVVEAAAKSGSLITADCALEQGRDVFAVPNGIYSPVSQGVNNLLKAGAKPACNAGDILEEYTGRFPGKIQLSDDSYTVSVTGAFEKAPQEAPARPVCREPLGGGFSPQAASLYACLTQKAQHLSALAESTGLTAAAALAAVTELELAGKIEALSGRRYRLPG